MCSWGLHPPRLLMGNSVCIPTPASWGHSDRLTQSQPHVLTVNKDQACPPTFRIRKLLPVRRTPRKRTINTEWGTFRRASSNQRTATRRAGYPATKPSSLSPENKDAEAPGSRPQRGGGHSPIMVASDCLRLYAKSPMWLDPL